MKPAVHFDCTMAPVQLIFTQLETPIGIMLILTDHDGAIRAIDWADFEQRMRRLLRRQYGANGFKLTPGKIPTTLSGALNHYFAGEFSAINALPVVTGGTDFQRAVWTSLRNIPAGKTTTYAKLAQQIGKPLAVRAVGHANGSNPVAVVVPCHRVIGTDGSLTGYGGGMERKRWLLQHESRVNDEEKQTAIIPCIDLHQSGQEHSALERPRGAS